MLLAWPNAAMADMLPDGTFSPRSFICPLGGERFEQVVEFPHFPLETFPDGSHPGDEFINAEIAACPGNGLVILPDYRREGAPPFSGFTAEELAKLPGLIADPAYQALAAEGRHAQAWWLARALGRPAWYQYDLMLRATWHAADGKDREAALTRLVDHGSAALDAIARTQDKRQAAGTLGQRLIIANALRELGRFDDAAMLLGDLEKQVGALPGVDDEDNPEGWDYNVVFGGEIAKLSEAIGNGNQRRRPMAMMSSKWAAAVCNSADERPLDEATAAECAERESSLAQDSAESERVSQLLEDPEALTRLCTDMADKRDAALARACDAQQFMTDMAAGDAMKADPVTLARRCEATPEDQRDGALRMGCISYDSFVESKMGEILTRDDAAFTTLCPDVPLPEMRKGRFASACHLAEMSRTEAGVAALLAKPELLDQQCAGLDEEKWVDPLSSACLRRKSMQERALEDALANDDAAFAKRCGRFADKLARESDNFLGDGDDPELRLCRTAQYNRDWMAARRLLGEPDKLKPRCDSTPEDQRDSILNRACYELEAGMAELVGLKPGDPVRPPFGADGDGVDIVLPEDPMGAAARPKAVEMIKAGMAEKGLAWTG